MILEEKSQTNQKMMLPSLMQIESALGKKSFKHFVKLVWHLVSDEPFEEAIHINALIDHLQACTDGRIKNIIVNLPIRHGKTIFVQVLFPAWIFTFDKNAKFLVASANEKLRIEMSEKCRNLMQSEFYQYRWPIEFAKDQNTKEFFKIKPPYTGFRAVYGVKANITGSEGQYLILDDPLDSSNANSKVERESINDWYDNTWSNRIKNPKKAVRIILAQRLHIDDLCGHILANDKVNKWVNLILPARFEGDKNIDNPLGFHDPRTKMGEPLWPTRYGIAELDSIEATMSELQIASQLQQRCSLVSGNIFKKEWFDERIETNDQIFERYIYADTASSVSDTADFSSIICVEIRNNYTLFVRDLIHKRIPFYELQAELEKFAEKYQYKLTRIYVEGKANGISLVQNIKGTSPKWMGDIIQAIIIPGSKEQKFYQASLYCEKGCILLPVPSNEYPWFPEFFEELSTVPNSTSHHDDSADSFSNIVIILQNYFQEYLKYKYRRVKNYV